MLPSASEAKSNFRLVCEYGIAQVRSLAFEARTNDMVNFHKIAILLNYENKASMDYPLSQKKVRGKEIYSFVLNEGNSDNSMEIQIFETNEDFFRSKATISSIRKFVNGTCQFRDLTKSIKDIKFK